MARTLPDDPGAQSLPGQMQSQRGHSDSSFILCQNLPTEAGHPSKAWTPHLIPLDPPPRFDPSSHPPCPFDESLTFPESLPSQDRTQPYLPTADRSSFLVSSPVSQPPSLDTPTIPKLDLQAKLPLPHRPLSPDSLPPAPILRSPFPKSSHIICPLMDSSGQTMTWSGRTGKLPECFYTTMYLTCHAFHIPSRSVVLDGHVVSVSGHNLEPKVCEIARHATSDSENHCGRLHCRGKTKNLFHRDLH